MRSKHYVDGRARNKRGTGIKLSQFAFVGKGQRMTCDECGDVKEVATTRKWVYVDCTCPEQTVGHSYPTKHTKEV